MLGPNSPAELRSMAEAAEQRKRVYVSVLERTPPSDERLIRLLHTAWEREVSLQNVIATILDGTWDEFHPAYGRALRAHTAMRDTVHAAGLFFWPNSSEPAPIGELSWHDALQQAENSELRFGLMIAPSLG